MFKKLKDKLAEEVKSSPQRIQQFAQAAQAAVTSASSSISDITNSDLFSIGDNDSQQPHPSKNTSSLNSQPNTFQDVALVQPLQPTESLDYKSTHDIHDNLRQRRLSNSSFTSDVSFRLPSYETPSMYHLQSDMEVSASEAEERGFSSGAVSLDRVTKEQLYAAYRRTQERYTKYRTQYGDLARHYKLLERENAKARSVLVETQDKALRRISELREQCALEQSAKAHLEKALRIEIEEKDMKIEALKTNVTLLQNNSEVSIKNETEKQTTEGDSDVPLIDLSNAGDSKDATDESLAAEIVVLNTKIEKMEQLLQKYKESLKLSKEKNSQINTELQILSNELETKNKEIEVLKTTTNELTEAKKKIQELNNFNEELENKINVFEFNKTREQSTLEVDYQKAQEDIAELRSKIEIFSKREEEYAISLAENKLSIHKELEGKETEIKSLKELLETSKKEIQSLNIVVQDYKNNVTSLEAELSKLRHNSSELTIAMTKIAELDVQIEELNKKCTTLEQAKTKGDEGYKCLQLQLKQETAEKLAMIDRNTYLVNRNTQLNEENSRKSSQIGHLEEELSKKEKVLTDHALEDSKTDELEEELSIWKDKYSKLESEIQEERDELIKLQSEIEKLLANHELLQTENVEYRKLVSDLTSENSFMQEKLSRTHKMKANCLKLYYEIRDMKRITNIISSETKSFQAINNEAFYALTKEINYALNTITHSESSTAKYKELKIENNLLQNELKASKENQESINSQLNLLQDENNNLKSTITKFETEKNMIDDEVKNITDRYEVAINDLNLIKEENENLLNKINDFQNNFQNLQIAMEFEKTHYSETIEKLKFLEKEKQSLLESLQHKEKEKEMGSEENGKLKNEREILQQNNEVLMSQLKELEQKNICINEIQEENKKLTLQNDKMLSEAKSLTDKYNSLETELINLRMSYSEIVSEKARLNEEIEKNISCSNEDQGNKNHQTLNLSEQLINEEKCESHKSIQLLNAITSDNLDTNNELANKYKTLKTDFDVLKEENRRYKSDIEGLQTYLTKISKENSVLNDKLRELIASEHSIDSNDVSNDLEELKKEIQSRKDKINDLIRENMLLVEENLELKDQLQSQNYKTPEIKSLNDKDDTVSKEKVNNLMQINTNLEKRLNDLEQMNRSANGNMSQMQEKNEKLRLTNEKLERRLDEALVSLRHLHSLQENTELEYLRNILYEYLTGSGMHSVTLAKVLSAIVKFDDTQTKLVMQKEKERQGFLRQLGII